MAIRWFSLALAAVLAAGAGAGEPRYQVYPTGPAAYGVLRDGRTEMTVGLVCWGPGWKWFRFGGEAKVFKERREVQARTVIGGTDQRIVLRHDARQAGRTRIEMSFQFQVAEDSELTQICLSVRPDGERFGGGASAAYDAEGEATPIQVPIGRGSFGGTFQRLVFRASDGRETALAIEPARPVNSEGGGSGGEARIQLVPERIEAGDWLRTDITLTLPEATRFYERAEDSYQRDDTSDWFPYDIARHGPPIDLSFLNRDDEGEYVKAGSHGFLRVKGDEFAFEDGTPARFWGLNVTAGAALGSPERAEQIAERLARLGCNVARLHHLDSWANPVIDYDHPDGTTQHLSPEGMASLDATVAALKARGIHVILDPWVQRCFKPADGVEPYGAMGQRGNFNLHPYVFFDPRMRALIQKQLRQVWTHVNPRTGLAYKDDPACILTECINEGLMQRGGNHVRAEPYRQRFIQLYEAWAKAHDADPNLGERVITQNYGRDPLRFYVHVCRDFYHAMHDHFRDIGLRIPVNATNWALWTWEILPQADLDFMDAHHYYGGDQIGPGSGLGGLWIEHPPDLPGQPFGKMGRMAVAGKPLTVSECGNNPPKTYRAAYPLGLAAVAALQGWDSITGYAFSQAGSPRGTLSAFEWESDPLSLAATAIGSLILRRGDVRQAEQTVAFTLPDEYKWELHWQEGGARKFSNTRGFNAMLETHKVAVVLGDQDINGRFARVLDPHQAYEYEHEGAAIRSDTGELWRDWKVGVATLDTPRTQAAMGRLGASGTPWQTADCTFAVTTPFAVMALSSLTDEPIAESGRLLLVAAARAQNTGMAFNLPRTKVVERGERPVICEPVIGTVSFRTGQDKLVAHAVAADGSRTPVPIVVRDGIAELRLEAAHKTLFYEIHVPSAD
ncbi:MAG: hypothetical protein ACODAJ_09025 [Planctomycetota bacterium]